MTAHPTCALSSTNQLMQPDRCPSRAATGRIRLEPLGRFGRWAMALVLGLAATAAQAQQDRKIPSAAYYGGIQLLYDGEYKDANKVFAEEWRGAIKTPASRWIDSICYHAMLGESYYQVGDFDQALEHYTAAVRLYTTFPDWMRRVSFAAIRPQINAPGAPWGVTTRGTKLGHYPDEMLIGQGRIDNNAAYKQGGVVQQAQFVPINVVEILRCTVLAIRRRGELLGPVARYDTLNQQLINLLSQRPTVANHWSQVWVDAMLGSALSAGGKDAEAIAALNRSLVAGGEYDHPLTSGSLLELGKLALLSGNQAEAARLFFEASIAAYHYPNLGILEESLTYGALVHLVSNGKGVYPPLGPAGAWAKTKGLRQLRAALLLSGAENLAVMQQTPQAVAMLDDAQLTMGRRPINLGRLGARLNFLRGLTFFQQKKVAPGDEAIAAAMTYMQHGSFWLYHIAQADTRLMSDQITPRVAMDLYNALLRDPQPQDYAIDPMETLAVLSTPHAPAYEHWFLVAMKRNDHDAALEIADRTRRHRFYSSLAFGGRLLALRWVLEAPQEALGPAPLLQRQDLASQYPAYVQLSKQAADLRAQLRKLPLVADSQDVGKQQSGLMTELGTVSMQQEAALREIAVRRGPSDLVFPPLRPTKELQKMLPRGTAVLAFFSAGGDFYAFLITNDKYGYWNVKAAPVLGKKLGQMLREMGNWERDHPLSATDLKSAAWKQTARQVLETLLSGSSADFSKKFPELVIVPDEFLWYVPFEALQVNVDGELQPLITRFRMRYAPTVGLAVPDGRGRSPNAETAVVLGKLAPGDDAKVAEAAYEKLAQALPGTSPLRRPPLPGPTSLYKTRMGRLIVFDDLNSGDGGPYSWFPVQIERNKRGNALNDWMALPWGGPETVILPGFHTNAENALKKVSRAPGMEIFLSTCGLMSTGAKTILISRWRTGGRTSYNLVREFAQELPHTTPADAWQRSVLLAMDSPLDAESEPRVKPGTPVEEMKVEHPLFWAGYVLIDSGSPAEKSEEPAKEPEKPAKPGEKPKPEAKPGEKPAKPDAKPEAKPEEKPPANPEPEAKPEEKPAKPGRKPPGKIQPTE